MTKENAKKLQELALDLVVTISNRDKDVTKAAEPVKDAHDRSQRKRLLQDLKWAEERIADLEKQIRAIACSTKAANRGSISRLLK